jgi:hypothetical protein
MSSLHNDVFDLGITELGEATALHVCSAEPTDRATALALSLGNAAPTVSAPEEGVGGGRQVTVSQIVDLAGTAEGTATHWAIIDGARLLATGTLLAGLVVVNAGVYSLASFTIRIPDPA